MSPSSADRSEPRLPDEKSFIQKAARQVGRLPFVRDMVASYYAVLDSETPMSAKVILAGAIAYFVMPVDLIPDFIVGFGFMDDAAVFTAAFKTLAGIVNPAHYRQADEALGRAEPAPATAPTAGSAGPASAGTTIDAEIVE
jgi:uncharacterized membrane protein YkvA (DUF1232 family)